VGGSGKLDSGRVVAETWRVYNLQRGCTSAVLEGITALDDGRWTAVGRGNGPFLCSWLIRSNWLCTILVSLIYSRFLIKVTVNVGLLSGFANLTLNIS
jgi:hypothetical protein